MSLMSLMTGEFHYLSFSSDGGWLGAGSGSGVVCIYDFKKESEKRYNFEAVRGKFTRIYFMHDQVAMLVCDRGFITFDVATGKLLADRSTMLSRFDTQLAKVTVRKCHQLDEKAVLMTTSKDTYLIKLKPTESCTVQPRPLGNALPFLKANGGLDAVSATLLLGKTFRLRGSGEKIRVPSDIQLLSLLATRGEQILCTYDSHTLCIINEQAGVLTVLGGMPDFTHLSQSHVSHSSDGKLVFVSNPATGRHWVIDTVTGHRKRILPVHCKHRFASAISPDGKTIALVTIDDSNNDDGDKEDDHAEHHVHCDIELIPVPNKI